MFVSTTEKGTCFALPDVCKVPAPPAPPIPTPFPNTAMCAQATGAVMTVLAMNKPILVLTSKIPMSAGDEAGSAGGMVSGTIKGPVTYKTSSNKVFAAGKKMVMLTAVTAHNGTNANMPAGAQIAPSQTKVLLLG